MSLLAGSRGKLAEARFFLALLKRIENCQPVTNEPLDCEATYFTSALLSACYSVLEHLRKQGKRALRVARNQESKELASCLGKEVDAVLQQNRMLYNQPKRSAQPDDWGLRHLSVHHKTVDAKHHDRMLGTLGSAQLGRLKLGEARRERRLYVIDPHSGAPVRVVLRMTGHVRELEDLVTNWADHRIADLDDPDPPSTESHPGI